jgi:hypothetical protein
VQRYNKTPKKSGEIETFLKYPLLLFIVENFSEVCRLFAEWKYYLCGSKKIVL